jgi:hypothetical protein
MECIYSLLSLKGSKANDNHRFLWALCQLNILGKCRNREMLRKSLATLPPTLDQTFDRVISAISKDDSEYAIRILRRLTFSTRPLSVEVVAELVAIDVERDPAFDRDEVLVDSLEALNICSSLITITTHNKDGQLRSARQVVALAHYSINEYPLSDRIWKGQAAQYGMQDTTCHEPYQFEIFSCIFVVGKRCLG